MINKQILIVDDQEINRVVLLKILQKNGFKNIFTATSGADAIRIVTSNKIDIIFMDIEMPVLDGFKTSRYIKDIQNKIKSRIKIVGLSGHNSENIALIGKENGMDSFITKPFKFDNIILEIQNAD